MPGTIYEATGFCDRFPRTETHKCHAHAQRAATRTRRADEPYASCLRREIVTRAQFIQEWTSSDKNFDEAESGELVSIARQYALPRSWRVSEPVASLRGHAVAAQISAQPVLKSV